MTALSGDTKADSSFAALARNDGDQTLGINLEGQRTTLNNEEGFFGPTESALRMTEGKRVNERSRGLSRRWAPGRTGMRTYGQAPYGEGEE